MNINNELNSLPSTEVAVFQVSTEEKGRVLSWIEKRFSTSEKTFVATPYAEFLREALVNPEFRQVM